MTNNNTVQNFKKWFPALGMLVKSNPVWKQGQRLRSRTRSEDMTQSVSMRVHDPLWTLARQWQMGEFRGNDAATAMAVKCTLEHSSMQANDISADSSTPLEYSIERINAEVTPQIRVEAARYYLRLLSKYGRRDIDIDYLKKNYPLDEESCYFSKCGVNDTNLRNKSNELNHKLDSFIKAFKHKTFDGYKLYLQLVKKSSNSDCDVEFKRWFSNRYTPIEKEAERWDTRKLSYDGTSIDMKQANLKIGDYSGGTLSWYSFDNEKVKNNFDKEEKIIHSLPVLATYPSAPNKRLWQFEDYKVHLGNSTDKNQSLGNILLMQYASMYSNDWMLIPIETEIGKYIQVKELVVWDTFGERITAKNINQTREHSNSNYGQRWRMFNIAPSTKDGQEIPGILLPLCFASTLEGKPIEEVNFLRDEMANMIWGVETLVPDGAGGVLDLNEHAQALGEYLNETNEKNIEEYISAPVTGKVSISNKDGETKLKSSHKADFSYVIQTTVPLNWIPFVPQRYHKDNENRETILRRGKMPVFVYNSQYKDNPAQFYLATRPVSSLINTDTTDSKTGEIKENPFYINEEEILQSGVKIVKNYQRGRWLNGKVYHWLGVHKQLNKVNNVSGLTYDKLNLKKDEK